MKIRGLDGKDYSWIPSNKSSNVEKRSSLHKLAKEIIKKKYPYDRVIEEVVLPGTNNLRADFFLPNRDLIIEVHGSQHVEFNNFFFKSKLDFHRSQARDSKKKNWCSLNGFTMIELFHNETAEEWERKI